MARKNSTLLGRFVLASAICLGPSMLHAQEVALSGTVTDTTDAVLPGVTVTAVHTDTGNTFVGVTDANGNYLINALRTGAYTLRVELTGFSTVTSSNLELQVGQHAVLNFKLSVSSLQESLTVAATAPLVELTQSKVGGNIDQRQIEELPLNGRNWLDLSLLSPGSRVNQVSAALGGGVSTGSSPVTGAGGNTGAFQLNLDGQQVTNQLACTSWGQFKFSNDAIQEFEMVTSRFDATQGRSTQVQLNVVTKAGTNQLNGTAAGYFRSDKFNSPDFISHTVLPYSDQQGSATIGGPIIKDRLHFFAYWDGERNPQSYTFTSVYPAFNNVPGFTGVKATDNKWGGRGDYQFNSNTHLMVRANGYSDTLPDSSFTGGALQHPSRATSSTRSSHGAYATLTTVLSNRAINELKGGYTSNISGDFSTYGPSPQISLTGGYVIGNVSYEPLYLTFRSPSIRDNFTYHAGKHQLKMGGEFLYYYDYIYWPSNEYGVYNATKGQPPANLQSLFPVFNNPSTWNLDGLNQQMVSYTRSFSNNNYTIVDPMHVYAVWLQDDWQATSRLTLNLGTRWDVQLGSLGESNNFPPFHTPRGHELHDVGPRVGFAYDVTPKTVIRGGWGMYYQGMSDQPSQHALLDPHTVSVTLFPDGRPDFNSNPWNGPVPTYDQALALAGTRSTSGLLLSQYAQTPLTYQTSVGVQQQLGTDMSFKADYVATDDRHNINTRNIDLTFNPATGANYPFSVPAYRAYPNWSYVTMAFMDGASNYKGLEAGFTKRMSHHWQASATYTLQYVWNLDNLPLNPGCQYPMTAPGVCNVPITLAPDLPQGTWYLSGAQRNRAVFNAIWDAPYHFQISGLYFYGDNGYTTTTAGVDVRQANTTGGRLLPDGTLIPRNNFKQDPLERWDGRIQRHFKLAPKVGADLLLEGFNLFNHTTFIYNTNQASSGFGKISTANQPRIVQLAFRLTY
jgi:carboxypeptidase family protein